MGAITSKTYIPYLSVLHAIIFTVCFATVLCAQSARVDSLKKVIANAQDETTRFEAINQLALSHLAENPDSAFLILDKIYPAVMATANPSLKTEILYTRGRIYEQRQQLDSAIVSYEAAKGIAEANNDQSRVASCLVQIGYMYHWKNESQQGLSLLKEALALSKTVNAKDVERRAANGIGRLYSVLAEFDSSNMYLNLALEAEKKFGEKRMVAEIYTNIANNYARANQADKALETYLFSQELMRALNDSAGIAHTYRNIGVNYFFEGKYPEAIESMYKAFQFVEGSQHHQEIIVNLDYLGEVYMTIEDYENAQLYWEKAIEAWTKAYGQEPNPDLLFKKGRALLMQESYKEALNAFEETEKLRKEAGQLIAGDLYWNMGQAHEMLSNLDAALLNYKKAEELSQNLDGVFIKTKSLYGLGKINESLGNKEQALSYYTDAYMLAQKHRLKENEMNIAKSLYRMYKAQNNISQSLHFIEISTSIQDSLFNERNTKAIARMQAQFEFEQEKQELAFAQEKERREQANIRRILWGALAVAGLILGIGIFYYRSKQKANAALSKLNAQVIKQKEKLEVLDEAKSRFFTNISHEFRTPLTIITGMIDQVYSKPDLWLEKGTKMIKQNADSLLNLVNQILDLRKLESNEMKVNMIHGDVVKHMRYITKSYESFAVNKGLTLHFLSAQEEIFMDYDAEKLMRIVSNLLSNAMKFTPEDGNIYFQVDQRKHKEQAILHFSIKDTGVGISEEALSQIFDRFYQVDNSTTRQGEGTGIGLALSQELVKLLGGEIRVESTVGKGSTFIVDLPITEKATIQAEDHFEKVTDTLVVEKGIVQPDLARPALKTSGIEDKPEKPRLLIVEDNLDVQQYLVACLEPEYQLTLAENGQLGIEKAIESIPDVIICDVMMPIKDGFDVCDTLKNDERTSHIPIILLTAKADDESRMSGLRRGADAYLTKPFNEDELLIRLANFERNRKKVQAHFQKEVLLTPEEAQDVKQENEFLQKIRNTLQAHIEEEDYGIMDICREIGMSRAQLHRKIKALTGESTSIFLRRIRLHKGKELLETTDMNVSQTAYAVGFSNPSYFSRLYIKEFGIPPNKTRK